MEQKNWAIVRTVVGYHRYDTSAELLLLNRIWMLQSLMTNYFGPQVSALSSGQLQRQRTPHTPNPAAAVTRACALLRNADNHAQRGRALPDDQTVDLIVTLTSEPAARDAAAIEAITAVTDPEHRAAVLTAATQLTAAAPTPWVPPYVSGSTETSGRYGCTV